MTYRYKVYVNDEEIGLEYPITIEKKDINDFCKWLNAHIVKWNLEVIDAYIVNEHDAVISKVHFLPREYRSQFFISNYKARLLAYAEKGAYAERGG